MGTSDDPNGPVARMRSVGGASRRAAVRGATPPAPPFAPSAKPGRGVPMKVSESHEGSDSDNASRSHDDCAHISWPSIGAMVSVVAYLEDDLEDPVNA
jgi:hypothetical protein